MRRRNEKALFWFTIHTERQCLTPRSQRARARLESKGEMRTSGMSFASRAGMVVRAAAARGGGRGGRGAGGRGAAGGGRGRTGKHPPSRSPAKEYAPNTVVVVDDAVTQRNLEAVSALAKTLVRHRDADPDARYTGAGFRLVRCMPHLKRREADAAVSAGRVLVNGELVRPSTRVKSGDVVTLDGKTMRWEPYAASVEAELGEGVGGGANGSSTFVYLLYNKPRGVVCTVEPGQRTSLLYALERERKRLKNARFFPVGRLDKDSSGLVLLTNDGRVSDALLDPSRKAEKEYDVDVHKEVREADVDRLAAGVVITTTQQRGLEETTAPTQPCEVRKIGNRNLRFVLKEGRNRQIRKMCEALGYDVTRLHRTRIDELTLGDLEVGGLRPLDEDELKSLSARVRSSREASADGGGKDKTSSAESKRRKAALEANPTGWGAKLYKEKKRDD